jgi:hypothetical protein
LEEKLLRPQTVVEGELKRTKLVFHNNLFERDFNVEIVAQHPERSYEDRSVFCDFNGKTEWLNAEQALELGKALIEHGTKAFEMNMIQHQLIHHKSQLERFLKKGRVAKTVLTLVSKTADYHGNGFYIFEIRPEWVEGKEPKYQKDFHYEEVIYFSPFEDEYKNQLKQYGHNVEFVGYDREHEVADFNKMCEQYN